jgi:hypothetical protein
VNKLVTFGIRQLFGGARRGQPGIAGLGAALAIIGWLRGRNHGDELLYKRTLKQGEEVRIKFLRGESADDVTVTG